MVNLVDIMSDSTRRILDRYGMQITSVSTNKWSNMPPNSTTQFDTVNIGLVLPEACAKKYFKDYADCIYTNEHQEQLRSIHPTLRQAYDEYKLILELVDNK